ncbi:hypothetical protein [Deinococcus peraridilitoris]|uniref:Uncharacterized protein n=1 Tax=Deinococcus peraridilitoris (strain DSM 19664 / LMG 22246 / CIP 109416 / KR-200) TaxID=937777 RepID=L0A5U6_DEIPD|nr:hypothetical protein [Deinococcus peraridilitoris]AFZ69221.1 hypothetical protein Deipe_3797 [Deinococcus peraridilitoris DSM 19664]
MTDRYNKPHSDQHGNGFSPKDSMVEEQMDNEVHQLRQQDEQNGGAIPEEAGNDFTFPDEDKTLGRKAGDDLPGEKASNRE